MTDPLDRFRAAWRHAFAIERAAVVEPDERARAAAERILAETVRRRLVPAALFLLESARPLNTLSAAAIQFFTPIASFAVDRASLESFAAFLERRGSVEWLCRRLEEIERERERGPARPADETESTGDSDSDGPGSPIS